MKTIIALGILLALQFQPEDIKVGHRYKMKSGQIRTVKSIDTSGKVPLIAYWSDDILFGWEGGTEIVENAGDFAKKIDSDVTKIAPRQ